MTAPVEIKIGDEFNRKLVLHSAVTGEVILITMDKITICLMRNRDCLSSKREWITPVSMFAALLTTLAVTTFRDYIVSAAVWQAMYILCTGAALLWSAKTAWLAFRSRGRGSIEEILSDLKKEATQL